MHGFMGAISIPYETKLTYINQEIGPIDAGHLSYLLGKIPGINSETMSFELFFKARQGFISGSSADLTIDLEKSRLGLEKIVFPSPRDEAHLLRILNGGKLETLNLEFPPFSASRDDFAYGAKAFGVLWDNLETLKEAGYESDVSRFTVGHHVVELPYPFGYFRAYGAKVKLKTEQLIKGKPERKLVLSFTQDMESSKEVRIYKELLDLFNRNLE